jgi:hypothetical protein
MIAKSNKIITLFSILTFNFGICFTQENALQNSDYTSEIIESQAECYDEIDENYQVFDILERLKQNPLDLNSATETELGQLPMVNDFQIAAIIDYRYVHGPFLSVNELNGVRGLPIGTIKEILPYIKIENNTSQPEKRKLFVSQNILINSGRVIEKSEGYQTILQDSLSNNYFPGNPYRLKARYRIERANYSGGFSVEKDPGEDWFKGSNKSFDYISFFAQRKSEGFIDNIVLGDYNANFGQGLVLWSGFAQGRSAFATNIRKPKGGFTKYSSFNENQFLRGIASTFHTEFVNVSLFFSKKERDANILEKDSSGKAISVSTIQNTGLHALQSEIDDEDALSEITVGTNVNLNFRNFKVGGTYSYLEYNALFQKPDKLYNFYSFSGKSLACGSINYQIDGRRFNFFGETARNSIKGIATINGILIELIPEITFALSYRYYSPEYCAPYAQAFSQNSDVSNEKGIYFGIEVVPENKWKISAYADHYSSPWLKYQINEPSTGNNYFTEIAYFFNENTSFSTRYSYMQKSVNIQSELPGPLHIENENLHKLRLQLSFKAAPSIELKNRVEWAIFENNVANKQNGILLYQDLKWAPQVQYISITGRFAIFNTEGWESRIYAYESDVLYSYSVPAYSGKGFRIYCMVKWTAIRNLDFWVRCSETIYADKYEIGQGANLIKGNKKGDINFQCLYRF